MRGCLSSLRTATSTTYSFRLVPRPVLLPFQEEGVVSVLPFSRKAQQAERDGQYAASFVYCGPEVSAGKQIYAHFHLLNITTEVPQIYAHIFS